MRYLIAIPLLSTLTLLSIPTADADCRARAVVAHHHQAVAVVKQAVVAPVAVAAVVPVAVTVPAYGVGYDPHAGEVQELRRAVKDLTQALQALKQGTPSQQPSPQADLQGRATQLLGAKCATCHTGAQSKGSLQLFVEPGKLNPALTMADLVAVKSEVRDGRMPPTPHTALSDDEYLLIEAWVGAVAKTARAAERQQKAKTP